MNRVKIKNCCNLIDYRGKTPEKSDSGYILITAKNVKDDGFSFEPREYIPKENYDAVMVRGIPESGDVLFTTEAPLGNVCRIPDMNEPFAVGQRIVVIRPKDDILRRDFLEHVLKSHKFRDDMWRRSSGSTVKGIRTKELIEIEIPIPDLKQQKIIAESLNKVSKIIDARQQQLEGFDNLIKSRFVELFGTPYGNEKGFPMLIIDDVIEFTGGSQPDKKFFEYEKTENNIRLIQIRDYKTDNYITYIPKTLAKRFCDEKDIMIGRYGPPIFQILKGIEGSYNVALMKATPKRGNKEYIRYFLKQECLFSYLDGLSQRTAGQSGIDIKALKEYPFPYPPIEIQEVFEKFVTNVDKLKVEVQKSLDETQMLFDTLMQKYFK